VILLLPLLSPKIITLSVSRMATATTAWHTMTDSTTSIQITTIIISHMITAINAAHANTTMIVRDAIMDRNIRNVTTTRVVRNTITDRNDVMPVLNTIPIRTVRNTTTTLRNTTKVRLSVIRPRTDLLCIRSRSRPVLYIKRSLLRLLIIRLKP